MTVNRKDNGKWNFWCPRCDYTETNLPSRSVAEGRQAIHNRKGCDK